jgi:predicted  nucleic acid-binding Zn-ribbon protein
MVIMSSKKAALALLALIIVLQNIPAGNSLTPGDYKLKFWAGGLRIWVSYPEEASPGETVDVDFLVLSNKFPRGNWVENVDATISVLLEGSSSSTLYDQAILKNRQMNNLEEYSQKISVKIPNDARWYMTIAVNSVSWNPDNTTSGSANVIHDSTIIRDKSYSDLNENIQELTLSYNKLAEQYKSLQTQLTTMSVSQDCSQLQADYLMLIQRYYNLTIDYNAILNNIGAPDNDDLEAAFDELNAQFVALQEEKAGIQGELNALHGEIDGLHEELAVIGEMESEIGRLSEENQDIINEFEAYKQSTESDEDEFTAIIKKLQNATLIRNVFVVTTLLAITIAGLIFVKSGLKLDELF